MTTDRAVIFWIAIAYVVVFSTPEIIEDNNNGVCKKNVSYKEPREEYYITTYQEDVCFWICWWTVTKTRRELNVTYVEQWEIKDVCCDNYKDNNGTCEPQCSSPCMNGYCAQPDTCACNRGWDGQFCDVPLLCVVDGNSTAAMSEPLALQSVQNVSENPIIEPMRPRCHSKCQEQFDSTTAIDTTQSADGQIQYLIPIDSPCNSFASPFSSLKKHIPLIGASIGFVLFAVIFCTLYIVRRKRKTKAEMGNKFSDQPKSYVCADYIEENPIYS